MQGLSIIKNTDNEYKIQSILHIQTQTQWTIFALYRHFRANTLNFIQIFFLHKCWTSISFDSLVGLPVYTSAEWETFHNQPLHWKYAANFPTKKKKPSILNNSVEKWQSSSTTLVVCIRQIYSKISSHKKKMSIIVPNDTVDANVIFNIYIVQSKTIIDSIFISFNLR